VEYPLILTVQGRSQRCVNCNDIHSNYRWYFVQVIKWDTPAFTHLH